MLPHSNASVADACAAIGENSADSNGFVPIRSLLERFQTRLIVRPLLVEGMIAAVDRGSGSTSGARWAVLIDSETLATPDIDSSLVSERSGSALPARLRYTIAHELAHSLAFRPTEFGIRLETKVSKKEASGRLVKQVEADADRLASILLLPPRMLKRWLQGVPVPISANQLAKFREEMGVSNPTLVNRLKTLLADDPGASMLPSLRNIAIGVGERPRKGQIVFRKWPVFANFDRSLVPAFLFRLTKGQDLADARDLFGANYPLVLDNEAEVQSFIAPAGTAANPESQKMCVTVDIERDSLQQGSALIFVVRGSLVKPDEQQRLTRPKA